MNRAANNRLLSVVAVLVALVSNVAVAAGRTPTIGDLGSKAVDIHKDAPVQASAQRAMDNYRRFLELRNTDPALRAEALRRLGDLNLESGELERMEKEVNAIDLAGGEAIKLYSMLLKAYPDYPRNDQVLYQLARAYETTGQPEQALATLDGIVQRFPGSPQLDEVNFRRGEILFSAKRYADAQQAYGRVIAHGTSAAYYQQSLYKHGWSLFKQSLNEESLPSFGKVLDNVLIDRANANKVRAPESLSRPERELVEDTLRVMAITFSYLDGAETLNAFLAKSGVPPYVHLLYARLGDLFVEKQRYQDAATAYRSYVARDPNTEFAPGLSMQAIEAYRKGGFDQLVLDGKRDYVERYNFSSAFWKGREKSKYPSVVAELKTNLKDVATYFHATAQKSKKSSDYEQAARWYRDFLKSFPDEPDSAGTNYLLAETLFESQQFSDAADEYERTAYNYPKNERSAAAGYAALAAFDKHQAALSGAERDSWHKRSVDASVHFAQTFPEHPDSGGVLTRAAQDVFALGDLPRATTLAREIIAKQPPVDNPKQRIAWTIIAQSSFDSGEFAAAEKAYVSARDLLPANDPLRKDLTERLAASVYKQGEAKRAAGDGSGAVEDFLRVAMLAPASPVRATAEYDAAAQLIALKQWERAIGVLEGFRANYPQNNLQSDVTKKLAVAYSEAGHAGQAAVEFEKIAAAPTEEAAVRREALATAADLYEKAGNIAKTVAVLERYVAQYESPFNESLEARQRLLDFALKAGNVQRTQTLRQDIIRVDAAAGAGRTDRSRFLAAKAQLALVLPLRDTFRSIKLVAPLKKSLAAKRKALEAARDGYKVAVDYRVAEVTTAATYETAELFHKLAQDIMASERPKKLNKAEREEYDTLLEEQALPFEDESIKLHELNAVRTRDGLWDESIHASFVALALLKAGRYGKTEQAATSAAGAPGPLLTGIASRLAGDLGAAETLLQAATAADANNAMAWSELGLVQRQRGKFAEARASYEKALALDPAYAPAHRNLGVLLDLYLGDTAAALRSFMRYKEITGEEKPVNGWIADLKQRLPKDAAPPAAPAPVAPAQAAPAPVVPAPVAPTQAAPSTLTAAGIQP